MTKKTPLSKSRSRRSAMSGFTLIELIMIIVLLGVLSTTVAPKFINLQSDARSASLDGVVGVIKSASKLVALKAKINNVDTGDLDLGGYTIPIVKGYMIGKGASSFLKVIDLSGVTTGLTINEQCPSDFCTHGNEDAMPSVPNTSGGRGVYIWPQNYKVSDNCFAYYYNKEDGSSPLIGKVITGC